MSKPNVPFFARFLETQKSIADARVRVRAGVRAGETRSGSDATGDDGSTLQALQTQKWPSDSDEGIFR